MTKYATDSDDPAERFLAVVAMAVDSAKHAENPIRYWTCAATISLARKDFREMIALAGHRIH